MVRAQVVGGWSNELIGAQGWWVVRTQDGGVG